MRTIVFTHAASRQLDALPPPARETVEEALALYAVTGRGDVSALTGREGYRLRVGSYRVLFDQNRTTILAIQIGRRTTTTYR